MRSSVAAYDEAGVATTAVASAREASPQAARPRVIALVPAHNEETVISVALASLERQTLRPERVVVVADNCTDRTAEIAAGSGAEVLVTVANLHKKAGGLNQALAELLPHLDDSDFVLAMDADSALAPEFIEIAVQELTGDVGAVGGNFYGAVNRGLLRRMQCNEYARFARDTSRKEARAWVLTGTGTVFRVDALRAVVAARLDGTIPGSGHVYDVEVLTEDNELTLALKHLGYRCLSPQDCVVMTDVMPTWRALWRQRLRWKRGAMENLLQYGVTRVTVPYILQHLLMFLGAAFLLFYVALFALSLSLLGGIQMNPIWFAPAAVFAFERAVTVRRNGWRNVLIAAVLIPEWCYEIFGQACLFKASADLLRRSPRDW